MKNKSISKIPGTYKLTHCRTGLFYIGHTGDFIERRRVHIKKLNNATSNIVGMREIYEPGDKLDWVLYPTIDKAGALILERNLIGEFADSPLICNQLHAGYSISDEHRRRISEYAKAHPIAQKITLRGLPLKPRKPLSPETIEKIRLKNIGRKHTVETLAKMSKSKRDNPLPQYQRDIIAKARSKPVTVDGITYESSKIAARVLGVSRRTIYERVKRAERLI